MTPLDDELKEIENKYADEFIRFGGHIVDAEDDDGRLVKAYCYHNQLFDMDCKPLHGYRIKKDRRWLLLFCGCLSFYIFYLLITGVKS